jgi:V8-like Glu-specific endopeptidase
VTVKRIPWAIAGSLVALSLALSACGGGSGGGGTTTPQTTPTSTAGERSNPAEVAASVPVGAAAFSPEEAADFWTPERLRNAQPVPIRTEPGKPRIGAAEGETPTPPAPEGAEGQVDGTVAQDQTADSPQTPADEPQTEQPGFPYKSFAWAGDSTKAPATTAGKIFFVKPSTGKTYVCSGTVVTADNESVVWTAGHCVYDLDAKAYMSKWVFVPAYKEGSAPLGIWPFRILATPKGWTEGDHAFDMGAAVVDQVQGKNLMAAVGGSQGLRWNAEVGPGTAVTDFGYPAGDPFDGEKLWTCDSTVADFDARGAVTGQPPLAIGCDMTGGSSGGGWLADYQPERGWGYVTSVNSYGYDSLPAVMMGPYQGNAAQNLYEYAKAQ